MEFRSAVLYPEFSQSNDFPVFPERRVDAFQTSAVSCSPWCLFRKTNIFAVPAPEPIERRKGGNAFIGKFFPFAFQLIFTIVDSFCQLMNSFIILRYDPLSLRHRKTWPDIARNSIEFTDTSRETS